MPRRRLAPDRDPFEEAKLYITRQPAVDRDGLACFFVDSYKGCGIFSMQPFSKAEFLLEYKGELISGDEGEKRMTAPAVGSFLFFFKHKGKSYCVDATNSDGLGRLVNDDRKPNAKMKVVEVSGIPHLALFALRPLNIGEEVLYDYGDTSVFWRKDKKRRNIYECPDGVEKFSSWRFRKWDGEVHGTERIGDTRHERNGIALENLDRGDLTGLPDVFGNSGDSSRPIVQLDFLGDKDRRQQLLVSTECDEVQFKDRSGDDCRGQVDGLLRGSVNTCSSERNVVRHEGNGIDLENLDRGDLTGLSDVFGNSGDSSRPIVQLDLLGDKDRRQQLLVSTECDEVQFKDRSGDDCRGQVDGLLRGSVDTCSSERNVVRQKRNGIDLENLDRGDLTGLSDVFGNSGDSSRPIVQLDLLGDKDRKQQVLVSTECDEVQFKDRSGDDCRGQVDGLQRGSVDTWSSERNVVRHERNGIDLENLDRGDLTGLSDVFGNSGDSSRPIVQLDLLGDKDRRQQLLVSTECDEVQFKDRSGDDCRGQVDGLLRGSVDTCSSERNVVRHKRNGIDLENLDRGDLTGLSDVFGNSGDSSRPIVQLDLLGDKDRKQQVLVSTECDEVQFKDRSGDDCRGQVDGLQRGSVDTWSSERNVVRHERNGIDLENLDRGDLTGLSDVFGNSGDSSRPIVQLDLLGDKDRRQQLLVSTECDEVQFKDRSGDDCRGQVDGLLRGSVDTCSSERNVVRHKRNGIDLENLDRGDLTGLSDVFGNSGDSSRPIVQLDLLGDKDIRQQLLVSTECDEVQFKDRSGDDCRGQVDGLLRGSVDTCSSERNVVRHERNGIALENLDRGDLTGLPDVFGNSGDSSRPIVQLDFLGDKDRRQQLLVSTECDEVQFKDRSGDDCRGQVDGLLRGSVDTCSSERNVVRHKRNGIDLENLDRGDLTGLSDVFGNSGDSSRPIVQLDLLGDKDRRQQLLVSTECDEVQFKDRSGDDCRGQVDGLLRGSVNTCSSERNVVRHKRNGIDLENLDRGDLTGLSDVFGNSGDSSRPIVQLDLLGDKDRRQQLLVSTECDEVQFKDRSGDDCRGQVDGLLRGSVDTCSSERNVVRHKRNGIDLENLDRGDLTGLSDVFGNSGDSSRPIVQLDLLGDKDRRQQLLVSTECDEVQFKERSGDDCRGQVDGLLRGSEDRCSSERNVVRHKRNGIDLENLDRGDLTGLSDVFGNSGDSSRPIVQLDLLGDKDRRQQLLVSTECDEVQFKDRSGDDCRGQVDGLLRGSVDTCSSERNVVRHKRNGIDLENLDRGDLTGMSDVFGNSGDSSWSRVQLDLLGNKISNSIGQLVSAESIPEIHLRGRANVSCVGQPDWMEYVDDSHDSSDSVEFPALMINNQPLKSTDKVSILEDNTEDDVMLIHDEHAHSEEVEEDISVEKIQKQVINDTKNSAIFMPALLPGGKTRKHKVSNKKHACVYCKKMQTSISKHLRTHKETVEVRAILDMESNKNLNHSDAQKDVALQLQLLKNKGDHQHNLRVLDEGKGHLIVSRRKDGSDEFDSEGYSPCPYCFLWLKEGDLYKHKAYRCPFKSNARKSTGVLITQSRIVKGLLQPSSVVVQEVFPSMTRDLLSRTAQNDRLIVALGDEWLRKASRNVLRRKNYASDHMRRAAKVLELCRIHSKESSFSFMDFLKPSNFDLVVWSSVKAAGSISQDEGRDTDMAHPSVALKFGHDLRRMAGMKESFAIKQGNDVMRKEAEDFTILLNSEWTSKVSVNAHRIADERKFSKKIELPPAEDLKKMSDFLKTELISLKERFVCFTEQSWDLYQRGVILVQVRLATYNKRRPGELEAMSMESYQKRHTANDVIQDDILADLTALERHLFDTHELVTVRGKRGTAVPVLLPPDTRDALGYITRDHVRQLFLKSENDKFLFANSGQGVFRVCDAMRELRTEAGVKVDLQKPDLLHCTLLRKYMATATQMLSVDDHEMRWIVRHMGHSMRVHEDYYRAMSSTIERAKIAKLLVLADQGLMGKYQGQALHEVKFEEISLETSAESCVQTLPHIGEESLCEDVDREQRANPDMPEEVQEQSTQNDVDRYEWTDDESEEEPPKKKRRNETTLPWTATQSKEIEEYFSQNIRQLKAPGKAACLTFLEYSKHPSNRKRRWLDIKNKTNAVIQRAKRSTRK